MSAIDRERLRCEDTCPVCEEGIDWEDGDHVIFEPHVAYCHRDRRLFDAALLDIQHLND